MPAGASQALPLDMAAAAGSEKGDETDDEDEPGIPAGQVRRRNRSWIAYAVLGGLLIALIVVTSVVLKGRSPTAPPAAEMKKTVVSPPAPSAEKAAPVAAVEAQKPGLTERQQATAVSTGQIPSRESEIRDEKKKPRQPVRTRQAAAKSPRRESSPATGGAPAGESGRDLSADRAGASSRQTAPQKAGQVESGEVIDWLLKKRAEQK